MSEPAQADRPPVRHPLFLGWGGFFLRLKDQGITPEAEGLRFPRDGKITFKPYSDIVEVNLSMNAMPRGAATAQTSIRFFNGLILRVLNTDAWGNANDDQTQHYYRFKADFHERLLANGAARNIRFTTGTTPGRAKAQKVILAIAAAFFIGTPIVLFVITRQAEALFIMLGGAALVIPFFRAADRNAPASYNPSDPPDMLR
ncbi:MAG: hypothetical protein KIT02_06875 [Devosia sp.]|uniref:hypothetical protein n=1 Tax=Devosia sp. TaxID=1871048 RepID=UPI0024C55476|nr:hypothetical protein [Devosia sp.]UYO00918.1 MAG: hypothetical protein KIT02_06875 [Devosia sp.]